ncbi:MAG: polymer-forming cytoskeletal protein [Bacteroidales bacterium]|nr:polymer-forming cytoskeletal protein [Bacteroidales bacterium]
MNIAKNETKAPKTVEQNVNSVSRIAQGAAIKGDLSAPTDIRVDGSVDGTLRSEGRVVAGESARLSGKLFCVNADIWGRMDGDIYVKEMLSLKGSSVVNGDIYVSKVQVELGAQVNGSFKIITEEEYDRLAGTASAAVSD